MDTESWLYLAAAFAVLMVLAAVLKTILGFVVRFVLYAVLTQYLLMKMAGAPSVPDPGLAVPIAIVAGFALLANFLVTTLLRASPVRIVFGPAAGFAVTALGVLQIAPAPLP